MNAQWWKNESECAELPGLPWDAGLYEPVSASQVAAMRAACLRCTVVDECMFTADPDPRVQVWRARPFEGPLPVVPVAGEQLALDLDVSSRVCDGGDRV